MGVCRQKVKSFPNSLFGIGPQDGSHVMVVRTGVTTVVETSTEEISAAAMPVFGLRHQEEPVLLGRKSEDMVFSSELRVPRTVVERKCSFSKA